MILGLGTTRKIIGKSDLYGLPPRGIIVVGPFS